MFVFAVAAPALLVVVLGYAVGYAAGAWASGLFGPSSPVVADRMSSITVTPPSSPTGPGVWWRPAVGHEKISSGGQPRCPDVRLEG